MKLPSPFIRLPLRFDAARLQQELDAMPAEAWSRHPTGYQGNSAVRLISIDGGENDNVTGGPMLPTPHLLQSQYIQQILSGFGVVWSRSRLMKLAPGAEVPKHVDINYHWFTRVRVHIPIQTQPEVLFHCGGETVHMAAGEAWIFDNWRPHSVENRSDRERVHLVADTTGSAAFWQLVASAGAGQPDRPVAYQPGKPVQIKTEKVLVFRVMPPAELEHLLGDLAQETVAELDDARAQAGAQQFRALLQGFCYDWRQMWTLYGDTDEGVPEFARLLEAFKLRAGPLATGLRIRSNKNSVQQVLNARLHYAVNEPHRRMFAGRQDVDATIERTPPAGAPLPKLERPLFVVAASRSGSTLLFETLASTPQLWTVGGEAHWLVEGFRHLVPGAPGIDSNRLTAEHADPAMLEPMLERIGEKLRNGADQPWADDGQPLRFLEKTPKNSLRIPFLDALFPDALFIYLWRDPCENISSLIEAWKSGDWITYPRLRDWEGPWSMLLPPGWRQLKGRPLAEIAAFQWQATNSLVMDDLAAIPAARRVVVRYDQLLADPATAVQGICRFAGLEFDQALKERVAQELPASRYTQTAPRPEKWRMNAAAIEPLLPGLEATWRRLRDFR